MYDPPLNTHKKDIAAPERKSIFFFRFSPRLPNGHGFWPRPDLPFDRNRFPRGIRAILHPNPNNTAAAAPTFACVLIF
jgi:hypothetical protein